MQMTCREFNQKIAQAQRAAQTAPVFITNRGKPAYVLMTQSDYDLLTKQHKTAFDVLMNLPDAADAEFEIPPRSTAQREQLDWSE